MDLEFVFGCWRDTDVWGVLKLGKKAVLQANDDDDSLVYFVPHPSGICRHT